MNRKHILLILRLSCFFLFFGRAWQHIVWDAPFRVILWDEGLLKPIIEGLFGMTWDSYATSMANDQTITSLTHFIGWFYALCALLCVAPLRILRSFRPMLLVATASLTLLAFLYSKDKFYELGMFIEHTCQFLAPLILYCAVENDDISERLLYGMKLSVSLTFLGHGLYAAGFYPVPGNFIDMTINILHVSQPLAVKLLFVAGIIDFIIAAFIFVPKIDSYVLTYAIGWGLLTSLARSFAYFDSQLTLSSLNQWLPETIMRMPHAALPLCVFLALEGRALHKSWKWGMTSIRGN